MSCFPKHLTDSGLRNNSCLNIPERDETGIFYIKAHPSVQQKPGSNMKTRRMFKFLISP